MTKAKTAQKPTVEATVKAVQETVEKNVKAAQETVQKNVKVAQETVQKNVKVAQETVQKNVKAAQETVQKNVKAAQKNVEKTVKTTQENVQKNVTKAVKEAKNNLNNVTEFNKANYDALVASGEAVAKISKTVNVDFIETAKEAVKKNTADVKTLFAAKTPTEFFELQANMFKSRYEEFVAESTRVNEEVSNIVTEVVEPITARYKEVAAKYNLPLVG